MPEPIYRLRFDQQALGLIDTKGAKGPSDTVSPESEQRRDSRRRGSSTTVSLEDAAENDIAPDEHIENIVNSERSKSLDTDLLDSGRPIE